MSGLGIIGANRGSIGQDSRLDGPRCRPDHQPTPRQILRAILSRQAVHGAGDRHRSGDLHDCGRHGRPVALEPANERGERRHSGRVVRHLRGDHGCGVPRSHRQFRADCCPLIHDRHRRSRQPQDRRRGRCLHAVSGSAAFLLPFGHLHTGALTVDTTGVAFVDIGGALIVPPGAWCSIAASATASTTVGTFGMIYEEVPV